MRRYISLLLFIGLACGQEEYPYFIDPAKQLEFEKNKVLVTVSSNICSIKKGGQSLDGLEFLRVIGLNEEAERKIDNHYQLLVQYKRNPYYNKYVPDMKPVNYLLLGSGYCIKECGWMSALFIPFMSYQGELHPAVGITFGVIGYGVYRIGKKIMNYSNKIEKKKIERFKKTKPEFNLDLNCEEIKNLAESYNRSLYKMIKE